MAFPARLSEPGAGKLRIGNFRGSCLVRAVTVLARNIGLLVGREGRRELRMKRVFRLHASVAGYAVDRLELCLMRDYIGTEARVAGDADELAVGRAVEDRLIRIEGDVFAVLLPGEPGVRVAGQAVRPGLRAETGARRNREGAEEESEDVPVLVHGSIRDDLHSMSQLPASHGAWGTEVTTAAAGGASPSPSSRRI